MRQGHELGLRGRGPAGYRRSDARIHEDVCDRLTDDRQVDAGEVEVEVAGGEVTLRGSVPERGMRRRAELLAEQAAGVLHVQNDLRVARPAAAAGEGVLVGWGTPVAAAYGLAASPSAEAGAAMVPDARADVGARADRHAGADADAEARSVDALAAAQAAASRQTSPEAAVTVAALFDAFADAEAAQLLLIETGIGRERLALLDRASVQAGAPTGESGLIGTLKTLLAPSPDAELQTAVPRRGGAVLTATVPEAEAERVATLLRDHGAVEVDRRRGAWRAIGWRDYEPDPAALGG